MPSEHTAVLEGGAPEKARRRRWPAAALSPSSVALACLCAGLCALALPVAVAPVPPLLDYPNHLARLWLLSGGIERPPLSAMYAVDWTLASTNIGIDLLAATLGRAIGGDALGPLLVLAALVLPPLGAALLNRAVFGGWHWWQAGFVLFAFNGTLLAGFLNFQIGLGLALLAAALDPAMERRAGPSGRLAARAALCSALLVFHAFAAAFYAVLLAGLAFGGGRAALVGPASLRSVRVAGPALGLPLAAFLLVAPRVPGGHRPPELDFEWALDGLASKLGALASAATTYDPALDVAVLLALWAAARIAAPASLMRVHAGLLAAALLLLALAAVTPFLLAGTAYLDWRLPIMALLVAVAAASPNVRTGRAASLAACFLLLLGLARTGWIAAIWHERQADVGAVERALAQVPAGAAVLPAQHLPPKDAPQPRGRKLAVGMPTQLHFPALAVPRRAAFVPILFTAPGKQPLTVLPPWDAISVLEGMPVPVRFLHSFLRTPDVLYHVGYAQHWRTRFDYLLLINADVPDRAGGLPPQPELELLADEGYARLYRIRRAEAGPAASGTDLQEEPR